MTDALKPQKGLPGDPERALKQFNQQDEKGLKYFFDQLSPCIYETTYRYLGNEAESEEVVYDTFLKVFRSGKEFKSIPDLRKYLYATARNIRRTRYKARQKEREELSQYETFIETDSRAIETTLEDLYSELLPTIDKMPEEEQKIAHKLFKERLSNMEIAKDLDLRQNRVAAIKFRVLEKVRKTLGIKKKK